MIPIHRLKGLVNTFLKSRGYRCEKYIPRTSNHLTLFRLGSAMLEQAYTSLSFVQIGGYDGVSCDDPVFAGAARRGWTGAVLEPQPDAFESLKENYKQCAGVQCINAALHPTDGRAKMFVPINAKGARMGALATLDRSVLERGGVSSGRIDEIEVEAITFRTLLTRTQIDRIDMLVIDTEGYDFEILKMVDFSLVRPALVRFEHIHLSSGDRSRAIALLSSHGYAVGRDEIDLVAFDSRTLDH